jgi:uncharacterized membrane protein (DUF2068 family)
MEHHPKGFFVRHFGLRGIAILEAGKGLLALGVGIWLLTLLHKDMNHEAEHLLQVLSRVFHMSPDNHLYRWLLGKVGGVTHKDLALGFSLVMIYMIIRFVEGAGLWLEKEWAEWFALISASLYMPFEIYELARHATWIKWGILGVNILIVLYLAWLLRDSYRQRKALQEIDV